LIKNSYSIKIGWILNAPRYPKKTLIAPYSEQLMVAYALSTKVNSPKNGTPELTAELI